MNSEYKGTTFEIKTRFSGVVFEEYDFTGTNFNSGIFENVTFKNCRFHKSNLSGSKVFRESRFDSCHFLQVDLSNSTFGSHEGIYNECTFEKCNFRGKEFNFSEFIGCVFLNSTLRRINFNGSRFRTCKFVGKLDDVSFNGMYDTNPSSVACLNDVDFSDAVFGEFVNFYNCDLSSCVPPKGSAFGEILYQIYKSNTGVMSTGTKDRIVLD